MRVLVVRPAEAGARTARRLAALGHDAVLAPLLTYEETGNPCPDGVFDILVATSAQAFAPSFSPSFAPSSARTSAQGFVPALRAAPLYVVGARTAQAAQRAGFPAPVRAAGDAAGLAQDLAQDLARRFPQGVAGLRALYLAGVERKPHLEAALRAMGVALAVWEVYAARPAAALPPEVVEALAGGRLEAALHFSRRSAQIFCALVAAAGLEAAARGLRHVAISADAAQGLRALAPADLQAPAVPEEAAMLDLLRAP
jgi:uroporphyrinogen-III synthase